MNGGRKGPLDAPTSRSPMPLAFQQQLGGLFHKSIRPFPKGQREMAALGCVTVP
jgi:hypothetical protein